MSTFFQIRYILPLDDNLVILLTKIQTKQAHDTDFVSTVLQFQNEVLNIGHSYNWRNVGQKLLFKW